MRKKLLVVFFLVSTLTLVPVGMAQGTLVMGNGDPSQGQWYPFPELVHIIAAPYPVLHG